MMNIQKKQHAAYGECLFIDNGIIEIAVPVSFGLRVGYFSFVGSENVFFEQPSDMLDFNTAEGWKIRGGHRLWLAPDQNATYYPDNEPITYEIDHDEIILTQKEDTWFKVIKRFKISMEENRLHIKHEVTNTGTCPLEVSLWSISVMAPGGVEIIPLETGEGGMAPISRFSFWDHTNPGDSRAEYRKDRIILKHQPISDRYKIGVGHPVSPVRYELNETVFLKHFDVKKEQRYPDGNVSFETFMSQYMVEIESLSPMLTIQPEETAEHQEVWELCHK